MFGVHFYWTKLLLLIFLFKSFLQSMGNQTLKIIMTDQGHEINKASGEESWAKMIHDHNIQDHSWLKGLYK
ncbi:hypothetical protein GQ457_11G020850 [Hibiscus cannabinus]